MMLNINILHALLQKGHNHFEKSFVVKSEVLAAVIEKISTFRDVMSCLNIEQHFKGTLQMKTSHSSERLIPVSQCA